MAAGYWRPALGGAVPGLVVGLATGYLASSPGLGALMSILPLGIGVLWGAALLIVGALRRRAGPVIAALAIAGAGCVGFLIAPGASGSTQRAEGTATVGTRAAPAAIWSGSVSCEWQKEWSTGIVQVRGFDVSITDEAFLAAEELRDVKVTIVNVDGSVFYEGERTDVGWQAQGEFAVDLEGVSSDGRTGTAVFTYAGGVVFSWSCAGGP